MLKLKVFDEFVLRECVEGIEFELDEKYQGYKDVLNLL